MKLFTTITELKVVVFGRDGRGPLVAVSVTHARLFVFAFVSALSYAVASRGTYT
jgi:hypothetical protein